MGQQRWKNEAFQAFSGQHAWHIYTQLDAEPSLSESLQTIDEYCPSRSGLLTGIVRHPSTWTGILKGYYSPFLNGMRTKPGPPQDSHTSFEDLAECAAHQDEQKTSAEAAALALRASCLYGWAKVPLLCIQHADPWRGRLLHADLAMRCFQGQDSCDMMLMARMIFCPVEIPDCKARHLCFFAASRVAPRHHFCKEVPCCTLVVAAGAAALLVGGCQLSSPLRDGLDSSCCQKASCTHIYHERQHSRALRCQLTATQTLAAVHR